MTRIRPSSLPNTSRRITAAVVLATWAAFAAPGKAGADDCIPTASDYLGPFYVSGTRERMDLNRFDVTGRPLQVVGKVLSASGDHKPIAGARLEVWHTDGTGNYHPNANGNRADIADKDIDLRGTVVTDETGTYRYSTVVPAAYGRRPPHFHYRITAQGFGELVTQHYIREEGRMPGGPCRSAALSQNDGKVTFAAPPIYLEAN